MSDFDRTGASDPPVVGWVDSRRFDGHDTGPHHPDSSRRLRAIRESLRLRDLDVALCPAEAQPVERALLERVHDSEYLARLQKLGPLERHWLDSDTLVSSGSFEAARYAAGAGALAVRRVLAGEWSRAFCSVRPPGHHAGRARGAGFCLLNNAVIAAEAALVAMGESPGGGSGRVAIVDFDVHHGDGTQELVEGRGELLYASWHQWPLYPGTGGPEDGGTGPGVIVNCPLGAGAGSSDLLESWRERVLPALQAFRPRLLVVSAGFDGDYRDTMAELRIDPRGYYRLTREIARFADAACGGRLVSLLEGGYEPQALGEDVCAHVEALLGYEWHL